MALTGSISLNTPSTTQEIIFSNPTTLDSITYSSNFFTYPISSSFVLSQSDFANFWFYKQQFYNSLLANFGQIQKNYSIKVPVCSMKIYSSNGPNIIQYTQTSSASPITQVYNITFDRGALTATFAARYNLITITTQEFLMAYPIIGLFANQCTIS